MTSTYSPAFRWPRTELRARPSCTIATGARAVRAAGATISRTSWAAARAPLRRALAGSRPELVHTSNLPGFSTAVWETARQAGVPVVHTLHDYHLLCPRSSLTRRDGTPVLPASRRSARFRTRRLARWAPVVSDVIAGSDHLASSASGASSRMRASRSSACRSSPVSRPRAAAPAGAAALDRLPRRARPGERAFASCSRGPGSSSSSGSRVRIAGDGRLRQARSRQPPPSSTSARCSERREGRASSRRPTSPSSPRRGRSRTVPPYVVAEWVAAGRPVLCSTRGGLAEARALPGVVGISPTAEGIVAGARGLLESWDTVLADVEPVRGSEDVERWLAQHEAVYRRAV